MVSNELPRQLHVSGHSTHTMQAVFLGSTNKEVAGSAARTLAPHRHNHSVSGEWDGYRTPIIDRCRRNTTFDCPRAFVPPIGVADVEVPTIFQAGATVSITFAVRVRSDLRSRRA